MFDAFLSYSQSTALERDVASAIKRGLHRFGKPWYGLRQRRVFLDTTNLGAERGLGASIENALRQTDSFVYVASPAGAASKWVEREFTFWLANAADRGKLFVVLVDGAIAWDDSTGRFSDESTAIPDVIRREVTHQPRHVSLAWVKEEREKRNVPDLSLRNPRFNDAIADLVAGMTGRDKDTLVGEDLRQRRSTLRLVRATIAVLAALLVLAVVLGWSWRAASIEARAQAANAGSRALAFAARSVGDAQPDLALLLAAEAYERAPTEHAIAALQSTLVATRHVRRFLHSGSPDRIAAVAFDHDGSRFAVLYDCDGSAIRLRRTDTLDEIGRTQVEVDHAGQAMWIPSGSRYRDLAFRGRALWGAGRDGVTQLDGELATDVFRFPLDSRLLPCRSLGFDRAGERMAFVGNEHFCTYDFREGRVQLRPGVGYGAEVRVSPDGRFVALSRAASIHVWDFDKLRGLGKADPPFEGALVATLAHESLRHIVDFRFGPSSETLVALDMLSLASWRTGDGVLRWVVPTPHGGLPKGLVHWPAQNAVVTYGGGGQTGGHSICVWNAEDGALRETLLHGFEHATTAVAIAPSGAAMVSGDAAGVCTVWDSERDPFVRATSAVPAGDVVGATFCEREPLLALAYVDGRIVLFDHAAGEPVESWQAKGKVVGLAVLPDGALVSCTQDGWLERWVRGESAAPRRERVLEPGWQATSFAVDVAGRHAAVAAVVPFPEEPVQAGEPRKLTPGPSGAGLVRLLDARSFEQLPVVLQPESELEIAPMPMLDVRFDSRGERLFVSGCVFAVFATATGRRIGTHLSKPTRVDPDPYDRVVLVEQNGRVGLEVYERDRFDQHVRASPLGLPEGMRLIGHEDGVTAVAFHPTEPIAASSSYGGATILWSIATGLRLGDVLSPGNQVRRMAFSKAGQELVFLLVDGRVVTMDVDPASWASTCRAVANRELTQAERVRHGW